MQIVIDILENQIKISEERLKIKHYPVAIEPGVRMKIEACKDAIKILDSERIKRTESLNNQKSQQSSFFVVGQSQTEKGCDFCGNEIASSIKSVCVCCLDEMQQA